MKNKLFVAVVFAVVLFSSKGFSQFNTEVKIVKMDTMVTVKGGFIIGKIVKVTETEIEFKKEIDADAPIYVVDKSKLKEIRWGNGKVEKVEQDEMDVNKEFSIIDLRSAIKFNFFSLVNDQVTFTYEHTLKVGYNAEVSVGIINNSMLKYSFNSGSNLTQGVLAKAGVKYLLGTDYYIKGLKYTHPLKGRYLKPEISYSSFVIRGVQGYLQSSVPNSSYYNGYYYYSTPVYSDRKINACAITLNYGRQFILGNMFTIGYSVGLGYSFVSSKYTNPVFNSSQVVGGYSDLKNTPTDLYTHLSASGLPVAFTGTFTFGYIFK